MTDPFDAPGLVAAARAGSVRATARLLSIAETGGSRRASVATALVGLPRHARVIGITGAPGAGKSTLTNALLRLLRTGDRSAPTVAVLAVDPSSPFSGGALLGDRVRMAEFATDPGVFIRSLSSRGDLGGLSAGAPAAVDLMSALGYDIVIVETVGVGQSEVEVMNLADTVVVVLAPGMGDSIQAAKAGIMEIADILVVNKADRDGARATLRELKSMARIGAPPDGEWAAPIVATTAEDGTGVAELLEAADRHAEFLREGTGLADRRSRRAAAAVRAAVLDRIRRVLAGDAGRARLTDIARRTAAGESDYYRGAQEMLAWLRTDGLDPQ